ncbi:MAG: hypothetical protein VX588_12390 [Verrucomicrobiota bacterium]|nr:hypothetical protein [Verrucomicrobiota bacterium]
MLPFDPSALAPQLAAIQQRERMLAELQRLDSEGRATDDNKAEIKELKRLLEERRKQLAEQKKDQDKQKEIQDLLYEVFTELKDLDERLKVDGSFEAAAKEFIDLYKRTNFGWILDHKNYDSLDFKELANKTDKLYRTLIKNPKLKILIKETDRREAERLAKELVAEEKRVEEREAAILQKKRVENRKRQEKWIAEKPMRRIVDLARKAIVAGELDVAKDHIRSLDKIFPEFPLLDDLKKKLKVEEKKLEVKEKEKLLRRHIHYSLWLCATIVVVTGSGSAGSDEDGPVTLLVMLLYGWIPCWLIAWIASNRIMSSPGLAMKWDSYLEWWKK